MPLEKLQERLEEGWVLHGMQYVEPGFPSCTAFNLREGDYVETSIEVGCSDSHSAISGIEEYLGGTDFKVLPVYRRIDRWLSLHSENHLDARWVKDQVVVLAAGRWRMALKQVTDGGSRNYQPRVIKEGVGDTLLQALVNLFVGEMR